MSCISFQRTPLGEEFHTPYTDLPADDSGAQTARYKLVGTLMDDGSRSIEMHCTREGMKTRVLDLDRTHSDNIRPFFALMGDYGSDLFDSLYRNDPSRRQDEHAHFDDWISLTASNAMERWLSREDASIYGKIMLGDYVLTSCDVPDFGRIFRWDRSAWRNEICFVHPVDDYPSRIPAINPPYHQPRRLTTDLLNQIGYPENGHLSSGSGHWSAHEIFEMIHHNMQSASRTDLDKKTAFGFD